MKSFWRWVRGEVPPVHACDQAVARQAYADYLHAQIVGFAPANADALLAKLTESRDDQTPCATASFPELMGVETRLVDALSDDLIDRTYWVVRERFDRVVGPAAIAAHMAWSPAPLAGPAKAAPSATTTPATTPSPTPAEAGAPAPEVDDGPPALDNAALAKDAAVREVELRRDQSALLAAADASDLGQTEGALPTAAEQSPSPTIENPAEAAPGGTPPEDH